MAWRQSLIAMALGALAPTACARQPEACCDDLASCSAVLREARQRPDDRGVLLCHLAAAEKIRTFDAPGWALMVELLSSPSIYQRALGARAAWHLPPEARDEVVPSLARVYSEHRDLAALEALEWNLDPRAVPALIDALSVRDWLEGMGAVGAVHRLGKRATPALPRLAQIATSHWDANVRIHAALAYDAISLEANYETGQARTIESGRYRCPAVVARHRSLDGSPPRWTVQLKNGSVTLRGRDGAPGAGEVGGACADMGPWLRPLVAVGEECLATAPGFEGDDTLVVVRDGEMTEIGPSTPLAAVKRGADVLVVDASDAQVYKWTVQAASRALDGTWSLRPLVRWWGSRLLAYAMASDGGADLLVLDQGWVRPGILENGCEGRTRFDGDAGPLAGAEVLLHVGPDGAVTALE